MFAPEKHDWPMDSTERGMQIDLNTLFAKHASSIRTSRGFDPKTSFEILEFAKHHLSRISIELGMLTNCAEKS
jgi:hypothetical protein